jgi:hypothetical protein
VHPSGAWGADDAKTTFRSSAGRTSAISWATKLPMEKPKMST